MGHRAKLQRVVGTLFIIIAFVLAPPVHGHREDDCYEALYTGQQIEACISAAAFKWNLNGSSSVEDSCCAIFEGLNCALNHSCTVCPPEDLSGMTFRKAPSTLLSVVNNNKKVASQKSGLEKTSLGLVRSKSPSKSTRRAKVKRSGDVQ